MFVRIPTRVTLYSSMVNKELNISVTTHRNMPYAKLTNVSGFLAVMFGIVNTILNSCVPLYYRCLQNSSVCFDFTSQFYV